MADECRQCQKETVIVGNGRAICQHCMISVNGRNRYDQKTLKQFECEGDLSIRKTREQYI
jgi:uncharacterized Fe-S cluster protein YjdI